MFARHKRLSTASSGDLMVAAASIGRAIAPRSGCDVRRKGWPLAIGRLSTTRGARSATSPTPVRRWRFQLTMAAPRVMTGDLRALS